ncbi:hypothetical protein [Pseudohongiella sp.]|uniref:Uncharacterized protein n=1 Tax=marine sediment metagenome TaxID=412755 RepID=A0A0F9Z1I2_9ZZZZ|nr:hypothetical protein [Pseudohongiella sp.]HDZ08270.1 hypothetical protein [Pseudohongiella sp.]HEA62547.1 hypothetical protein [Pseudohongiella sp.]
MVARFALVFLLLIQVSCVGSSSGQDPPEYWAEIFRQYPSGEAYQRLNDFLGEKPIAEQLEFRDRVTEARLSTIRAPSLEEAGYKSYEKAYIDLIDVINRAEEAGEPIHGLENYWREMKLMLDSPFRFYGDEVVSLIPVSRMTTEQQRQLVLVTAAMNFSYAKNLAVEGVPLRLTESTEEMAVWIGALPIIRYGSVLYSAKIELAPKSGEPIQIVHR